MSSLISSAVGGKKAAPKAAPRRRPAPLPSPALPTAATPVSASSATSVAPPSPPPTEPRETSQAGEQTAAEPVDNAASPIQDEERQEEVLPTPPAPSNKRKRGPAPAKEATQPAKRVKKSSTRSNAGAQHAVQEDEVAVVSATGTAVTKPVSKTRPKPAQKAVPPPTTQKTKATTRSTTAAASSTLQHAPTGTKAPPGRPRKSRAAKPAATVIELDGAAAGAGQEAEAEAEAGEVAEQAPQEKPQQQSRQKTKRSRKKGAEASQETPAETPDGEAADQQAEGEEHGASDPELHEIDPNTVTMFEIGGDKRFGKTSEREKKMAEIDWNEVARKRREAIEKAIAATDTQQPPPDVVETTEGQTGIAESRSNEQEERPPAAPSGPTSVGGVRFRIVNGQIVEDESSLTIDRQAQAEADAGTSEAVEEETDLTQRINRTTWLNERRRDAADRVPVWRSERWSDEDTERFYTGLRMFGTDFMIISKMFPSRTRAQIKHKFTREERLDAKRVNDTLAGKATEPSERPGGRSNTLEVYARESGREVSEFTKYEDVAHAQREIEESMRERRVAMQEAVAEEEENERAAERAREVRERRKKGGVGAKKTKEKGEGGKGRKKKKVIEETSGGGDGVQQEVNAEAGTDGEQDG